MDEQRRIIPDGAVYIDDGKMVSVGKTEEVQEVSSPEFVIDAKHKVVLPGFVNTHMPIYLPITSVEYMDEYLETSIGSPSQYRNISTGRLVTSMPLPPVLRRSMQVLPPLLQPIETKQRTLTTSPEPLKRQG